MMKSDRSSFNFIIYTCHLGKLLHFFKSQFFYLKVGIIISMLCGSFED